MVARAAVTAPKWRTESLTLDGIVADGPAEVTLRWLDAGQRWSITQAEDADPYDRMYAAVAAVVLADDGDPLWTADEWKAWSSTVSNEEVIKLLDKAMQAAGLRGDAEKK